MAAKYNPTLVSTLLLTFICLLPLTVLQAQVPATDFIRSKCNGTKYPQLCFDSLSSYAPTINNSPVQLANAALSVTLKTVQSTSAMMSRLSTSNSEHMSSRQAEVVSDCVKSLDDSVEYLKQSLKEMRSTTTTKKAGKEEKAWVGDVQTWVSTALTDQSNCMDAFGPEDEGKAEGLKGKVKGQVVTVVQMTCNSLALVAGLAATK